MIAFAGTLLLAASLSSPAGQRALSLLDVPFISQSEALCGGAAAAMVLRYWGARGVVAEDFAPLVDRQAGGIRTADLVRAVVERGWTAAAAAGTAPLVRAELAAGRPVIALIEDRPGAFHYVVVVGWHDRALVVHDPARVPYVVMRPADFERRWKASGNWMMAIAPGARDSSASTTPTSTTAGRTADDYEPAAGSCEALVADGVRLAQQNALGDAERLLAEAVFRCPGAAAVRELAGVRLLQRRWPEVRELAERAVAIDSGDTHAWRLLATSRFIEGDHWGALDAWNHAAEPSIELVAVSGLQRTPHRTVERLLSLSEGQVLTNTAAHRARRRLSELPSALTTRLEYVPRPSGRAEVRAHVAERTRVPAGRITWAAIGLQASASRELSIPIVNVANGGERITGRWRFWPGRPAYGLAFTTPAPLGVASLEVFGERQPFTDSDVAAAERISARARLATWATGALRWEARGGIDRWQESGAFAAVGGALRFESARSALSLDTDLWLGTARFVGARLRGGWRSAASRRGTMLDLAGGFDAMQAGAPLDLWPAGDTGHARTALLRAHPVLDDGRLRVERLGRHLLYATAEAQHWWRSVGAATPGVALFVDAGRTAARRGLSPLDDVDVGVGGRVALPGQTGLVRIDFAHGLRDGRRALSLAWVAP